MQAFKQFGGFIAMIGIGSGTMIAQGLNHLASFVDYFGPLGAITGGILGAAGVMGLFYRAFIVINRIDRTSTFTQENIMSDKEGTLLWELKTGIASAKKAAEAAKEEAAGAHELNKKNSEILAAMRGHSHIQTENLKGINRQVQETMPEILHTEKAVLTKVEQITPTPT